MDHVKRLAVAVLLGVALVATSFPATAAGFASTGALLPDPRPLLAVLAQAVAPEALVHPEAEPGAPLPVCRYRDDATRYRRLSEWHKTLLDTNLRVRRSYAPTDLVPVSQAGIAGTGSVRSFVIPDLRAMAAAAKAAGNPIAVRSAYRSYATQVATFNAWVQRSGYEQALLYAARPGHSEHQLGTTLDFRSASSAKAPWDYSDWGQTPAGTWMRKNSWKYGFVLSYPKGKRRQSCYGYEPWHFRYVGRATAKAIRESGKVPRAWLWETHETAP
jgi:zinc D-Ala-D-Ala carboxypeptidase